MADAPMTDRRLKLVSHVLHVIFGASTALAEVVAELTPSTRRLWPQPTRPAQSLLNSAYVPRPFESSPVRSLSQRSSFVRFGRSGSS